jgi:hypothetical protein
MDQFIAKQADKLPGSLSCFDRGLCRGSRPFFRGDAMASVLDTRKIPRRDVKRCVLTQADRLQDQARQMAAREGRPDPYCGARTRKEDLARQLAEGDGITPGLGGVFATVDPGRTVSRRGREGSAFTQSARRQCRIRYDYFLDRDLGLLHVRRPTWCPLPRQVDVNGHEGRARKLAQHDMRYAKHDNACVWLEAFARAQRGAARFVSRPGGRLLARYARRVNPGLADVLTPRAYYGVTPQAE